MKLTIGMAAYDNPTEVWFTVQALRLYQNTHDVEILVVDNSGSEKIKKVCSDSRVRYEKYTEVNGTAMPRNKVFDYATGDFVVCMDSHVLFYPEVINYLKWWVANNWDDCKNLLQGTLAMSNLTNFYTHYEPKWRGQMWGIWPKAKNESELGMKKEEILMMGMGVFCCRKDSWLRFEDGCSGFGGVEGVVHQKYRNAGRKVYNLPWLKWVHMFGSKHSYPLRKPDKIRNFLIGFKNNNMIPYPDGFIKEFGESAVKAEEEKLK